MLHRRRSSRGHPDVLADCHRRFRYILVDEYQDTNLVQYLWLRLLAQAHQNICCVGDDDQSIYSWRGAEIENILRFEKDFPNAKVVRLESNYRSTSRSWRRPRGLIAHNNGRLGKTLRTGRNERMARRCASSRSGTARRRPAWSASEIEARAAQRPPLAEIAILVRAGFQTRAFEERLITLGVPYRVVGGLKFYERAEIRDAMAYLRVWPSRPTTWPSSGSSTPRSAASATPRCGGCMRSPAPRASRWCMAARAAAAPTS